MVYTVAYDVRKFARRKCQTQLTIRLRVLQRCLLDRRQQNCFLCLFFVIRQHRRLLLPSQRLRYLLRRRYLDCCIRDRSFNRQRQYHFHYLHQRRLRRQHKRQFLRQYRPLFLRRWRTLFRQHQRQPRHQHGRRHLILVRVR